MTLVIITLEQEEFVNLFLQKYLNYNPAGQKSWDTLHFWVIFQFTQVQPLSSPHKQCWMCVSRIFSSFNFV